MASTTIKFDIPATYMRGFDLNQQKGLQRLLAYSFANLPSNLAGSAATLTGALSAGTVAAKQVVTEIAANGAITIAPGTVKVTKAGVCAMTLAAPTALQEGTYITVISNTANAHTITATGLLDDGVTGGSKTTATFAAFAGATIVLCAIGLKWSVVSLKAVTVA